MSGCAEYEYRFINKPIKVAESEAKFKFDLRQRDKNHKEPRYISSERIKIPEINANWGIGLTTDKSLSKDFDCRVTIQNYYNVRSQIEGKYEVHFQMLSSLENYYDHQNENASLSSLEKTDQVKRFGYSDASVVGLQNILRDLPQYEFHIKVTIYFVGLSKDMELMKEMTVAPCWLSDMKNLIDSSDLTDFIYIVNGKEFKVHKWILSLASPVFRSTFTCGLDETKNNTAEIEDCDSEMFDHLLKFIYKGLLPGNINEIALELYKLAHIYQIKSLEEICIAFIMNTELTEDNVFDLYELANLYDFDKFKSDCWTFIKIKLMKIYKPLEGEPYSVEKVRAFLEAQSKIAEEIARNNAKLEELRKALDENQL